MHPTSVFASDPEVLHVPEDEPRETGEQEPENTKMSKVV